MPQVQPVSSSSLFFGIFNSASTKNKSPSFIGSIFSSVAEFFQAVAQGIGKTTLRVFKDAAHRPGGFLFDLIKIIASSWICHKCITSPEFLGLNFGSQVGTFIAGWLSYLVIDGVLHWTKDTFGINGLLHQEQKPVTRAALSILTNISIIASQVLSGNYISPIFQGIYAYIQGTNLSEVFMNVVDKIKSSTDGFAPFLTIFQHPMNFLGHIESFIKNLFTNPKIAFLNLYKGLLSIFQMLDQAFHRCNWKEILFRFAAILLPIAIVLAIVFTGGLSTPLILLTIGLGIMCAYVLTKVSDDIWPTED